MTVWNFARSSGVLRRAREKSNGGFSGSNLSLISFPFRTAGRPCANQAIDVSLLADCKSHRDNTSAGRYGARVHFADDLITLLLRLGTD